MFGLENYFMIERGTLGWLIVLFINTFVAYYFHYKYRKTESAFKSFIQGIVKMVKREELLNKVTKECDDIIKLNE